MKRMLSGLLLLPFLLSAQPMPQKLSIAKLWEIKRLSEPQLSPDVKSLLYGVRTYDTKANSSKNQLVLCDNSGKNPKAITELKTNANSAKWRPDGKKIGFLSSTDKGMQLFEINPDGSQLTQISQIEGGISGFKYSPTLTHIAYTADVKLDKEVKDIYPDLDKCNGRIIDGLMYRHWDAWHDFAYSHLFIAPYANGKLGAGKDIMEGEKYDCPVPPHGGEDDYNWSPDGNSLAYACKKETGTEAAFSTNTDIYIYSLIGNSTFNASSQNKGYDKAPQFSPDGKALYWLSMRTPGYESDKSDLAMFSFASSEKGVKNLKTEAMPMSKLTTNYPHTIEDFVCLGSGRVVFTSVVEGTKNVFLYDPKSTSPNSIRAITKGDHDFSSLSYANDGKNAVLVGLKTRIDSPAEVFRIDLSKGTDTQISFVNKDILSDVKMGRVEKRWIKATDGKQILTWVIYPPDFDPTKKYPTLLYCQGGPQSPVSQGFSFRWNFELMAANGYIVVAPNRRGLPGFGKEWNDAIMGDYGGQCMNDYLSAIDEVAKEPFVNKDKLGAVGASFGGYSVYWLAGNHQRRFKTFISHCGMFNMESWYGTTEEMFFAKNDNRGPYWSQTGKSNFDASPHKFVQNWDTPILVIHNEKDFRVPLNQGMEAFTAAQEKGVPSRFLYFPDENHWVTKPQNSILWQRVFFEWLDRWLK